MCIYRYDKRIALNHAKSLQIYFFCVKCQKRLSERCQMDSRAVQATAFHYIIWGIRKTLGIKHVKTVKNCDGRG